MTTYYLVQPGSTPREMIGSYVLAGDGIYGILEAFGMRTPVPLALCEVRGLPPLFPWFGGALVQEDSELEVDASDASLPFAPTYHLLTEADPRLPSIDPGRVYQYVLARQGVFLLAQCTGLRCLIPISQKVDLPGLAPVTPFVVPDYPPVDAQIVQQILEEAHAARDSSEHPIEQLYYLLWEQGRWRLVIPDQDATSTSVRARSITPEYERAFIEGHSHQTFRAKFSDGDYIAEVKNGAFRVYFVLGSIFTQPEMRVRLVVHGYECEVFVSTFFHLPDGIRDGVAHEWGIPT